MSGKAIPGGGADGNLAAVRLAEIKRAKNAADERRVLETYADLSEQEATAGKAVKDAGHDTSRS